MMVDGQSVEALRVGIEKGRHLIDEGPGAARAGFVHALFHSAGEECDFGVLPSQLYGDVGVRNNMPDAGGRGDDLLHKGQIHFLRQGYGARTGERESEKLLSSVYVTVRGKGRGIQSFGQHLRHGRAHIRHMALVTGIDGFGLRIENDDLDGGGTHVKADMGKIAGAGHGTSCPGKDDKNAGGVPCRHQHPSMRDGSYEKGAEPRSAPDERTRTPFIGELVHMYIAWPANARHSRQCAESGSYVSVFFSAVRKKRAKFADAVGNLAVL